MQLFFQKSRPVLKMFASKLFTTQHYKQMHIPLKQKQCVIQMMQISKVITNNIYNKMIFNNQIKISNLLQSSYVSGNIVFAGDTLYSPVNNTVKVIDLVHNQTHILPFENYHQNKIIVVSPDATLIIAIDKAGHSTIFNLKGNFVVAEFNFKNSVSFATFSQDGQLFAIAQSNGFQVYQCPPYYRTFEPFVLLKRYKNRHTNNICSIIFSPDSRFLVTCGEDNLIYINNIFPIDGYVAISLEVHRYKIIGIYYSHDMKYIYSIDSGANLFVWKWVDDLLTEAYNNLKASKIRKLNNLRGKVINLDQPKSEVNKQYFSQFEQKITEGRYIIAKKLIVTQAGGYLKRAYFRSQTGFLATAYSHGKFSIYKLVGQQLQEVQSFSVGNNKISSISVNQSCTWIALGLKSLGQLIVWEWKSQSYILNQRGFIHETKALAYNGVKLYATGTNQGKIKLWDQKSCFCIATFEDHQAAITDLKFSNPHTLFSSSLDGSVGAFDVIKYKRFRVFQADTSCQFICLQIDPSGQIVFAASFDPYQIYSWNVQTGHLLQVVGGHEGPVSCLAMLGQQLVSGSWDKTLKIHQIFAKKANVQTLDHNSQVTAIAINPNRKQIAISTMKGQIYIWQTQNANLIGIIESEMTGGRSYFSKISASNDNSSKYIKTLVYSTCGHYLYAGGKSKYLIIYDILHRMVLTKITLTKNKDLQGVVQQLNSRYIKNGTPTYQLTLQAQQYGQQSGDERQKLPGAKKIDISEIRMKLQVDVRKIIVKNKKQLIIATSFGTLVLTASFDNTFIFNPYQLSVNLTPQLLPLLLKHQQYASAIIVCLKLNLDIKKLIKKISIEFVKSTINQIYDEKLSLFIERLCENNSLSYRQLIWVQHILRKGVIKLPHNLRVSLQNIEQQVKIMQKNKAILQMSTIISGYA